MTRATAEDVPERFVVLGVVTAPDDAALAARGAPTPVEGRPGGPVVAVTAAALLSFSRYPDGRLRRAMMRSVDALATSEADALANLDGHLGRHYHLGARLVAFGVDATLGVLGRRARRHWLFEAFDFPRWSSGAPAATFDAAGGWGQGDTLADVCAATGIKGATALNDGGCCVGAVERVVGPVPPQVRRAEAVAMATALLMAHGLGAGARSPLPLLKTWRDLLGLVRASLPRLEHCASFRCDGLVDPDVYSIVDAPIARGRRPQL